MGYADTVPSMLIEYGGNVLAGTQAIQTVAGDITLSDVAIPSTLKGAIKQAYVDVIISAVSDTSGILNELDGVQYIQIAVNSDYVHPYNAIAFPDNALRVPANGTINYGRIYGAIDVSSYISAGDTVNVFWNESKAIGNVLVLYGCQAILRLIMG